MSRASVVVRRLAWGVVAASAVALIGCEGAQEAADRSAQEQYTQAVAALSQNNASSAASAADAAGAVADLSPAMAFKVHSLQGQIRMAVAQNSLNQAQNTDLNISRLLGAVRLATLQVQSAQSQMKADQGYDPAASEQQLQGKIAEARGGEGQEKWQGGPLLSLYGIDAQTSRLQAAINSNRQQADTFAQQKTALAEQADKLQQKSLGETGQQAVDDVTAAAEARRKAAEAGIEGDKLDAQLANLKADLAGVEAQRTGVNKIIADLNQGIADQEAAWKSVQQDIAKQANAVTEIAGPSTQAPVPSAAGAGESNDLPQPPPQATTIADECSQLKGLIADAYAARDQAATNFKQAIKDFTQAAGAGELLRTDLSQAADGARTTPVEKTALAQLQETYSAAAARLAAADAERALATNYASQAMIALQVQQALSGAQIGLGAKAPAAIADCLAAIASPSVEDLAQLSEDSYKDALDHYDNLMVQTLPGAAAASRKTAAMVGKMIAAYGAKELSLALQSKPIAGQTPNELQAMINDLASNVATADPTRLPAIPYVVAPPAPAAQ